MSRSYSTLISSRLCLLTCYSLQLIFLTFIPEMYFPSRFLLPLVMNWLILLACYAVICGLDERTTTEANCKSLGYVCPCTGSPLINRYKLWVSRVPLLLTRRISSPSYILRVCLSSGNKRIIKGR